MIWIVLDNLAVSNRFQHLGQRDRFLLHFFTSVVGNAYSPFSRLRSYPGK
jgi:hypothetical protein